MSWSTHPVEDAVITLLSTRKNYSMQQIHDSLPISLSISSQQLYRIVAKMEEAGIVERSYGSVRIHPSWVQHIIDLSKVYEHHPVVRKQLPQTGEVQQVYAIHLQDAWTHIYQWLQQLSDHYPLHDDIFLTGKYMRELQAGYIQESTWSSIYWSRYQLYRHSSEKMPTPFTDMLNRAQRPTEHYRHDSYHTSSAFWLIVYNDIIIELDAPESIYNTRSLAVSSTSFTSMEDIVRLCTLRDQYTIEVRRDSSTSSLIRDQLTASYNSSFQIGG